MSKQAIVKYQGKLYAIQTPDDASISQAILVFTQQVANGYISKLSPGAILASPATLAEIRNQPADNATQTQGPDVSRQERETADVGRKNDEAGIIALTRIILSYPAINTSELVDEISFADYITQTPATFPVANLSIDQIQALMAAIASAVNQDTAEISQNKGVGRYGFNALQLELTGYLKPGTSSKYFDQNVVFEPNPNNFVDTMKSPNIWLGKDSVTSVDQILASSVLQAKIMQQLYQVSYEALLNLGTLQTAGVTTEPVVQGLILQNAVKYGIGAATLWAINHTPAQLIGPMKETTQQALYALQLLEKKIKPNENLVDPLTAYVSTNADTAEVNNAVREIIDNPKLGTG